MAKSSAKRTWSEMAADVEKLAMRLQGLCSCDGEEQQWPSYWERVYGTENEIGAVIYDGWTGKFWVQCPHSKWWSEACSSSKRQCTSAGGSPDLSPRPVFQPSKGQMSALICFAPVASPALQKLAGRSPDVRSSHPLAEQTQCSC